MNIGDKVKCVNTDGHLIGTRFPVRRYLEIGEEYEVSRLSEISYTPPCIGLVGLGGYIFTASRFELVIDPEDKPKAIKDKPKAIKQRLLELAHQLDTSNRTSKLLLDLLVMSSGYSEAYWKNSIEELIREQKDLG